MRRAKARFIEDHRVAVLRQRVRAWHDADALIRYCEAIQATHGPEAIAADPRRHTLATVRQAQAESAQALPQMPPDPSPRPEDLKPYLGHLSPYGPPL